MSPLVAYHSTRPACRDSILRHGLLPNQPTKARPYGVYVFNEDCHHPTWNSQVVWGSSFRGDLWEVTYIGPMTIDQYVMNGLIFLEPAQHVTLVTGNS